MASGLSFSGSAVGSMIAPLFILFFSDLYGVRGALIIIAGVWMQVFIIGALQRPPPLTSMPEDFKATSGPENNNGNNDGNHGNKPEVIWTSETSGKAALSVTDDQQVEVDIALRNNNPTLGESMDDQQVEGDIALRNNNPTLGESMENPPSYLGLLKRPQVLRVIIIITCGITGSRGNILFYLGQPVKVKLYLSKKPHTLSEIV